jgi:hypothetical protein
MPRKTNISEADQIKVLQANIDKRIAEKQENNKSALSKIERDGELLTDYVMPLGAGTGITYEGNGRSVKMIVTTEKKKREFSLHPHAVMQTAEKLAAPPAYVKLLAESGEDWKRRLAATILNEHTFHTDRQRVLVREIGGQVRGVLSDQYRRLSSTKLSAAFIESVRKQGAMIIDAYADDLRWYIEAIRREIIPIPTENNGIVYMAYGMRIQSSDFGDGALDLRAFDIQAVCINGMVAESLMRRVHLGGKIPDEIELSNRTYALDTKTQASAILDIVGSTFSKEAIMKRAQVIQDASTIMIDMEKEVKQLPKVKDLTIEETEKVQKVLMENKAEDGVQGEPTLWKLTQAVSAVGRDLDPRRKREMDEIAGSLLLRVKK